MEPHARCAPPALIKLVWGRLVQAVPLHQYLNLAVLQTRLVSATLGTRGQMEEHARSVLAAVTNRDWGLVLV